MRDSALSLLISTWPSGVKMASAVFDSARSKRVADQLHVHTDGVSKGRRSTTDRINGAVKVS